MSLDSNPWTNTMLFAIQIIVFVLFLKNGASYDTRAYNLTDACVRRNIDLQSIKSYKEDGSPVVIFSY